MLLYLNFIAKLNKLLIDSTKEVCLSNLEPLAGPPLSFSDSPQFLREQQAYYQGSWVDGEPHGKGSIYFLSGAYFEG